MKILITRNLSDESFRKKGRHSFFPNSYAKKPILLGREAESRDFNAGAPEFKNEVSKQKDIIHRMQNKK